MEMATAETAAEQASAANAFAAGEHPVIQANAGTGKPTDLALLPHAMKWRDRYLAFNRAVAQAFPRTVLRKTVHAPVLAAIDYRYTARLDAPRTQGTSLRRREVVVSLLRADRTSADLARP
jgi:hypothetical protein